MPTNVLRPAGRGLLCAVLAFAPALLPSESTAQQAGQSIAVPAETLQLRERQQALFQQLVDRPADLELMFDYATVSIQLQDYEPAISTLERMLIYRQDLPRVRLELGVAYFNLGSYEVSKLYFQQALEEGNLPDEVRARVDRYLGEIARRTKVHGFSVMLSAGLTYATNATLGPESDQILLLGNLATINAGRREDDFGARTLLSATHTYDLQQPDDDYWQTDASFYSLTYFDTEQGDVYFGRLRSGPRLSLDREQYGPKLRPYVEAQYLNSNNRGLFGAFGGGAEYTHTLSPLFTVFGDYGGRYRNYFRQEFTDEDAVNLYALTGLAYTPWRELVLRGTTILDVDAADADFNTNAEVGLRLGADWLYEPPVGAFDQKWLLSGYGEVRRRFFEENDPIIGATDCCRRDWDFRGGVSHYFAISGGFGIQLDVEALLRESNIRNFDVSNVSTTLSLQYRM